MRIDHGRAVTGEVFRSRQHTERLRSLDIGGAELSRALRILAERPRRNNAVLRVRAQVENRIQEQMNPNGPRFTRGDLGLKLHVCPTRARSHRHGPREAAPAFDAHRGSPLVVRRHEKRELRSFLKPIHDSGRFVGLSFEEHDPANAPRTRGLNERARLGIRRVHKDAVAARINHLPDFLLERKTGEGLIDPGLGRDGGVIPAARSSASKARDGEYQQAKVSFHVAPILPIIMKDAIH